jgi:hypothetical protein
MGRAGEADPRALCPVWQFVRPFHSSRVGLALLVMQVARDLDSVSETGISSNIGILPKFKFES